MERRLPVYALMARETTLLNFLFFYLATEITLER
jgi:hypothetical protein